MGLINQIDPDTNLLESVNLCIGLLTDLKIIKNANDLVDFANDQLLSQSKKVFDELFLNPSTFAKHTTGFISDILSAKQKEITEAIKRTRDNLIFLNKALKTAIDQKRFSLIYSGETEETNRFQLETNEVIISNKTYYNTFITGPILKNEYELVGVLTKWDKKDVESSLKHELGHYFRVVLEGKDYEETTFHDIGLIMLKANIPSKYLCILPAIWDNTEDLNEIYGIYYNHEKKTIEYDYLNESEFNLAEGKHIRYSHRSTFFTRVPYYIFQFFEKSSSATPKITEEIAYNELVDMT